MAQTPPTFARPVKQSVYDINSMSWVPMEQPVVNTDTLNVSFSTPIAVSGPLTDAQLRASAVDTLQNLSIPEHDYISLSYTGDNLTTVVFKTGGSGGTTVATLTLAYSGSTLISVTKS